MSDSAGAQPSTSTLPAPGLTTDASTRVGPDDRGSLSIADKVVEKIAAAAAREVGSVTQTGGRLSALPLISSGLPKTTARVAGGRSRIGVEVAIAWPSSAEEVSARVRDHVQDRVVQLTGITVDAVDVTVADIVHVETARRRVE